MKYRDRKYMVSGIVLLVFILVYWIAVPGGTPWVGKDSHLLNLSQGLLTGLIVLLVQFIADVQRDEELEELQATKIKRVLISRDNVDYYRNLLKGSRTSVVVMGVTASRFLTDFADIDHPDPDHKVLIDAINRGVKVRILLPAREHLSSCNHGKFDQARTRIAALKGQVGSEKLEARYYKHPATVSMVVTDKNCLVGPVFSNKLSQHTPTIHALSDGEWARLHLDYFEEEWTTALEG